VEEVPGVASAGPVEHKPQQAQAEADQAGDTQAAEGEEAAAPTPAQKLKEGTDRGTEESTQAEEADQTEHLPGGKETEGQEVEEPRMTDLVKSLVRTYVPYLVAGLIGWGVLPESLSAEATVVFTGLIFGAYYLLVRVLEQRWPWFGGLLGARSAPTYKP